MKGCEFSAILVYIAGSRPARQQDPVSNQRTTTKTNKPKVCICEVFSSVSLVVITCVTTLLLFKGQTVFHCVSIPDFGLTYSRVSLL